MGTKRKALGALTVFPVALLFATPHAVARFECHVGSTDGAPPGPHERVSATIWDEYARDSPTGVRVVREIQSSVPEGYWSRSRVVNFKYGKTKDSPWNLWQVGVSYYVSVEDRQRPLFGFLILDSGEYVVRLGEQRNEREKVDPKKSLIWVSIITGYPKDAPDQSFTDALNRARTMSFVVKYADGETLLRESFDLKITDVMKSNLATVLRMDRENCKYWEDPPSH